MRMKHIYGVENAFGGSDYFDENGQLVGSSVPGIGGGEDFYGNDGTTGHSVDSVFGNGQDIYFSDGKVVHTVDSMLGGKNICGDVNGYSANLPFGGTEIFVDDSD